MNSQRRVVRRLALLLCVALLGTGCLGDLGGLGGGLPDVPGGLGGAADTPDDDAPADDPSSGDTPADLPDIGDLAGDAGGFDQLPGLSGGAGGGFLAGLFGGGGGDLNSGACTDVLLVAARGTGEPGTLGFVVGDPLYRALQGQVGSASASPVDYPATAITLSGVGQGADDVVAQLTAQAEACPDQQFALSGYSQGAMVIVSSLADIPADVADRVAAVVLFGNPYRARGTGAFEDRTLDLCAAGDTVCGGAGGGGAGGFGHLSYGGDVEQAAQFIAEQLGG